MRIVSLLPSATEIVCALGAGASLVGRSAECDFPPEVQRLPTVMQAVSTDAGSSALQIDEQVRQSLSEHRSLYTLDLEQLARLAPDVILTQDLCRVCSVTDEEVVEACGTAGVDPRIVSVSPTTLEGVWASVESIGRAIGVESAASRLARSLRRSSESSPRGSGDRPRVVVSEWLDPPFLAGLWVPDMVAAAGGTYLGPAPGSHGHRTSWREILDARADVLIISPCSYPADRTRSELQSLPIGAILGAAHFAGGAWIADEAYFSRPGPRLLHGVELLRGLIRDEAPATPMPFERWPSEPELAAS